MTESGCRSRRAALCQLAGSATVQPGFHVTSQGDSVPAALMSLQSSRGDEIAQELAKKSCPSALTDFLLLLFSLWRAPSFAFLCSRLPLAALILPHFPLSPPGSPKEVEESGASGLSTLRPRSVLLICVSGLGLFAHFLVEGEAGEREREGRFNTR